MPKMKTHRGAAKRFRATGSGKFVRHHAKHSHILTKKGRALKRKLRSKVGADKTDQKRIAHLLPYA